MNDTNIPQALDECFRPLSLRRWFQFSLRTLMIAMLVVGCGLGWLVNKQRESQAAWAAVNTLWHEPITARGLCGTTGNWLERFLKIELPYTSEMNVQMDFSFYGHSESFSHNSQASGIFLVCFPPNLKLDPEFRIYPPEAAYELHYRFVSCEEITDATLKTLCQFKVSEGLTLAQSRISNKGLSYLKHVDSVVELDLQHTAITDDGLVHLATMQNLQRLNLSGTQVTPQGVANLQKLRLDMKIDWERSSSP